MLEVKDYSKQELADAIYAGNIKPKSRLKKLWLEISRCPQLLDDLHRLHYHTGDSDFTAQMVERIKYYLCIDWIFLRKKLAILKIISYLCRRNQNSNEYGTKDWR